MKLLFCEKCEDLFKLDIGKLRTCSCGRVKGKYVNNSEAVVNGKGYSIAIGNGALLGAAHHLNKLDTKGTRNYFIENNSIMYCWVRPHEGNGNPHTKIDINL